MTSPQSHAMTPSLEAYLQGTPFLGYTYSYPHKTAYRPFTPALPLQEVWAEESKEALFLYVHIPFCEMRCGFCNLFTLANPKESLSTPYMEALSRQFRQVGDQLGEARFARLAIGGGTPTFLSVEELSGLFGLLASWGVDVREIPGSCEVSPATCDPQKLGLLRDQGIDRISIGVQSFIEDETRSMGRPQQPERVHRALEAIRSEGFPTLNIDLIYGGAGQDPDSWQRSLESTVAHAPEEIYLYPLYVRPLTGLGRKEQRSPSSWDAQSWDAQRMALYRQGRSYLLSEGYEQVSMRMFRRKDAACPEGPVYVCQEDGMVGLGAGARSYTRGLHYCTEYAVGRTGIKDILRDYIDRKEERFAVAEYGFQLDPEDQKRRFAILSLLSHHGLQDQMYSKRFGSDPMRDFPQLSELLERSMARREDGGLWLTREGLEYSDVLGPWLYSQKVRQLSQSYELR